ncbi:MAG: Spy/CpxP family protein refolding chaperone [Sterolibacterium sp.]
MKLSFTSTCLAISGICLAGLGNVNAADAAQPAMMHGANAPLHAMQDSVANVQKRLDTLGKKLNLKSPQQDAWKAFSAAMINHAQEHAQEMAKKGPNEQASMEEMPMPDKMEKMAAAMRQRADHLSKLAGETKIFYDQLSPEQKTIFDLYAKNAWHDRTHNRMHDHMH